MLRLTSLATLLRGSVVHKNSHKLSRTHKQLIAKTNKSNKKKNRLIVVQAKFRKMNKKILIGKWSRLEVGFR